VTPGRLQNSFSSLRSGLSAGLDASPNGQTPPLPPRSLGGSGKLRPLDEERPAASLLARSISPRESLPLETIPGAVEAVAAGLATAPDGRKVVNVTSKLSKSTGSANVQSTFSISPMRRVSAGSSGTLPVTPLAADEEAEEEEQNVNFDRLVTTPSGLEALRWNVALGELLAHESDLFLPRTVAIKSLRSALRASSMMLVQWRVDPMATRVKINGTGETALHVAAQCEVCLRTVNACSLKFPV
jgi:hypothetical protein